MSESTSRFPQLFGGLALLSLALVVSTWLGGRALERFRQADNTITVTGSARKSITADFATWRSQVSVESETQQEAYQLLRGATEEVRTYFIEEQKLAPEALSLGAIQTQALPEYLPNGAQSGRTRAYRLSQGFEVRLVDVHRVAELAQSSMELLNRGLNFESFAPEYLYTQLSALRVEMLAAATEDARQRAEQILKSAGSQLGPVRSVRTGVFQITRPHSTEVSDYGMYDTTTIDKDITAVLSLTFGM